MCNINNILFSLNPKCINTTQLCLFPLYPMVHTYQHRLSKPNIITHEQKLLPLHAVLLYFVVYVTLKIAFHQALSILLLLLVAHDCLYPAWLGGHSLYSINISSYKPSHKYTHRPHVITLNKIFNKDDDVLC